jgi:3-phosphoshikimate 1-carboxyvinyltransferase
MSRLRVWRAGPLRGRLELPGDLHVGQEAILWAALADSPSLLTGLSARRDHGLLAAALRELGVPIADTPGGLRIAGVGLSGLKMPRGALDAGDSPSTLELLTALLAAQPFGTRVLASGAAAEHPLRTVIEPLRARGAHVRGSSLRAPRPGQSELGDAFAPVAAAPRLPDEPLSEVEIQIPDGDPATKRALLISGLHTRGITAIAEGLLSRDHVERALVALGVPVETLGGMTLLDTSELVPRWSGFTWHVPGDPQLFAYLTALSAALPGSDVTFANVLVNRSRSSFLEVLAQAGARIDITPRGDVAGNEPVAEVRVRSGAVRSLRLAGELTFRLLEEACALFALAPALGGRASLRDAAALRARPGDPLRKATLLARGFGVECTEFADGFDLDPASELRGQVLSLAGESGEHALLSLCLGLVAGGETVLSAAGALDALYPELVGALAALGAGIERQEEPA